jgi:putative transposon-encoded protein
MAVKPTRRGPTANDDGGGSLPSMTRAKFEVYGEEMIEKQVKQSGNSGRVYLPPEWVGKQVKIIRLD